MGSEWLLFAGVVALGQFSPGPDMVLLTRTALVEGPRAGWGMVFGIVTGLCVHAGIAIGGLAVLFGRLPGLERGMGVVAAIYLGWLGWGMVRVWWRGGEEVVKVGEEKVVGRSAYVRGLMCNLLNPKVMIFFAGITTAFLDGERTWWWPVLLWATIVGEGLVLWGVWVWVLQARVVRRWSDEQGRWLDFGFGLGVWGVAVWLLIGK
ncbi:MAG: LysE family translocator [Verrucomicrobiota bacterium]